METVQREEQLAGGGAALPSASLLQQGGGGDDDWLLLRQRLAARTGPDRRHGNGYNRSATTSDELRRLITTQFEAFDQELFI